MESAPTYQGSGRYADYICRGYMQVHQLREVLEEQSMSIGTSIGVNVESPDEISKVSQPCEACSLL